LLPEQRVLQRYIDRPLLLDQRKFHIRAYVLAYDTLQVYFSRDCLALCSGSRYQKNNTTDLFSHITNTAYQDHDPNFQEEKCVLQWNVNDIGPLFIQSGICQTIEEVTIRMEQSIDQMVAITGELFQVYQNEFGVYAPIEGCFEHYGLDFIMDETWQIYLLEVNPSPDLKQTGNRLRVVIEKFIHSTIDIVFQDHIAMSTPLDQTTTPCHNNIFGNMSLCFDTKYSKHQHH
jgi:tubulin---tyrosine ligase